ncbi:MobV family relaxase [Dysgonomonas macrotermitis]|uniref:Plasmid recombination enzyme n=1 Tax=Dysgonomonas macrotermitis TaxID=1346286 RepID=A0A1M4WMN3_9BACT|nr:MobV family relaxase [Dysgonomonas macrotermitis]SHE82474.1 Plasmid recombination enzyme [Dysgonomonas macrotermitis]
MGFAVLHIQKPKGNDARTSAHIERTVNPANADQTRTHLNENLIDYPDGVENRTQAIQHRIETAGIKRKISNNQVRALQVMLSGTHEDMQRIQTAGKLDEWCKDNIKWLQDTFGKENVVSAVLHLDEKTPHIHATIVPIVTGERRKTKFEEDNGKKKYHKKPKDTIRLCADDVMTRDNLERFQDTYAEKMQKYGLERGIKGSDARHISTPQYYRDLHAQNEELKENIVVLREEQQEVYDKTRDLYDRKDEAREKFLNMHEYTQQKETEISDLESRIEQLKQDYEPYKAQDDVNLLLSVFPHLSERLRIAQLCRGIGLTIDTIKQLFKGEAAIVNGKLHSPEHNQSFSVQDAKLQIFQDKNTAKLKLSLNGQNIIDWFKQKYQELKQVVRPHIKPAENKSKGIKM